MPANELDDALDVLEALTKLDESLKRADANAGLLFEMIARSQIADAFNDPEDQA